MHKSTILGIFLVSILFLAATTGMSMQVSAIEETEKLQSFSGSKKNDDKSKKFECKIGPFKGFYVADKRACNVDIPADPELLCEECIKYWLNFINNQQNNRHTVALINALATAINGVNFGRDDGPPGCQNERPANKLPGVQCLPIATSQNPNIPVDLSKVAQVYEICKQLELALKYIDKLRDTAGIDITPQQALNYIEHKVREQTESNIHNVVKRLFECFRESLLPVLFPLPHHPIRTSQESAMVQQDNQESAMVQQESIDQQQQQQIDQIKQQIEPSLGQDEEQQQQIEQQEGPSSSISQEQMHQQQIEKLKQLLTALR